MNNRRVLFRGTMLLVGGMLFSATAQAVLFTVNDAGDAGDFAAGNAVCETGAGTGVCTLRAAVEEANALAGADDIVIAAGVNPLIASTTQITVTSELTLSGQGADQTTLDGNANSRIFAITNTANVEIEGVTLTNGRAPDGVVAGSPGASGGAIVNEGTLSIRSATLSDNRAGRGGDGGNLIDGAAGGSGGAVFNSGSLTIIASTLSGNTAGNGGDSNVTAGNGGPGGAIVNTGMLTITNSTLSGNATGAGGFDFPSGPRGLRGAGGAIQNSGAGISTIRAATITGNTGRVGGAINQPDLVGGTLTLVNTLIADNTDTEMAGRNCLATDPMNDLIDGGGNLDDGESCFGAMPALSLSNAAADLGALANNGGPTRTHALQAGSDAIDSDFAIAGCPATDQRGIPRPQDGAGPGADMTPPDE
ncbi:MAG: hypothetical protein L0H83_08615, partial [Salinisphaera sp.]|nr:hypothetical protein [Salinisphaera sp.]